MNNNANQKRGTGFLIIIRYHVFMTKKYMHYSLCTLCYQHRILLCHVEQEFCLNSISIKFIILHEISSQIIAPLHTMCLRSMHAHREYIAEIFDTSSDTFTPHVYPR